MVNIKNKVISIILFTSCIIFLLIFIIINKSDREKSIEAALNFDKSSNSRIIHEEPTGNGSIVFSIGSNNSNEFLSTAFVNKNLFGYKDLYSGTSSLDGLDIRDLTASYFPAIKQTSLPIYFGVIFNDEIQSVAVKQNNSSKIKDAKIIEADNKRIWLVYMKGFTGTEFEIVGYNKNNDSIYTFKDTFSWSVEQKPFKSPYE